MVGSRFTTSLLLAATAMLATQPAAAQQNNLVLDSVVELERSVTDAAGVVTTRYTKPDVVIPGDRVRITLSYNNRGREPVSNLKLRNPIPDGLQYDGTSNVEGLSMSVDGGTTWGILSELTLAADDGTVRPATMQDVTHVMWVLVQPVAPGARGQVAFNARVR